MTTCPKRSLIDSIKGFLDPGEGRGLYNVFAQFGDGEEASIVPPGTVPGDRQLLRPSRRFTWAAPAGKTGRFFSLSTTIAAPRNSSIPPAKRISMRRDSLFDFKTFFMDTLPRFRRTLALAGLEETVVPIVSRSDVVARGWATPLSLVFIDGGHAFETARLDYECWAGHIMPGGYLLIHDIFEDPSDGGQAPWEVHKLALASGKFNELPRIKTLGVLMRNAK